MKQNTEKLLVTTKELQGLLSCGYHTAQAIGTSAGARVQIGRSVRWRIQDIKEYLKGRKEVLK